MTKEQKQDKASFEEALTVSPLRIEYDPDVDILTLWSGKTASNGTHIAEGLAMFFDEEDDPQIITLEGAAKLLLPYLTGNHEQAN